MLATLSPGQRWAVALLCVGCLPLAVETARYKVPKVLLGERVSHIDDKIVTELQFVRVKYKSCKMRVTKRNHTFMHLNTIDKFLYILSSDF